MDTATLLIPLLSALASFIATWLAAQFALRRFYREKVWERKTAAYTAIFEAIHDMGTWFSEHLEAMMTHQELSEEKKTELTNEYQAAKKTFERRLAAETWLIPDEIIERLQVMMRELYKLDDHFDWALIVTGGETAIFKAQADLRRMVRKDLLLRL